MTETGWWRVHFRKKTVVMDDAALERARARKVPKIVLVEPARTHECSVCQKVEGWGDDWSWFGSWKELDDDKPVIKFCSDTCRDRHAKRRRERSKPHRERRKHDMGYEPDKQPIATWSAVRDARQAANPRQFPMPEHPPIADLAKGDGQCRWCGGRITGTYAYQRSWHTASYGDPRDCKREWLLHTDMEAQRRFLLRRDGSGCQLCPPRTGRWVDGGPLYGSPPVAHWIVWSEPLEVDHCVELWEVLDLSDDERRFYFGPENLWLLCQHHHRLKSADSAARRAAARA